MWTVFDASVWQPSVPQFSVPASLEVENREGFGAEGVVGLGGISYRKETVTMRQS